MEIGEEIKQKTFASNNVKAMINLQYTNNQLQQSINKVFKPFGIQNQHFNVLRIIKGKHPQPVCPGEIKEVMLDKGRDLTRLIDKLEKDNLVTRKINQENRRMIDIRLSSKGIATLEKVSQKVDEWHKHNNHLTENEAETLSLLLDKFRNSSKNT